MKTKEAENADYLGCCGVFGEGWPISRCFLQVNALQLVSAQETFGNIANRNVVGMYAVGAVDIMTEGTSEDPGSGLFARLFYPVDMNVAQKYNTKVMEPPRSEYETQLYGKYTSALTMLSILRSDFGAKGMIFCADCSENT